MDGNIKQMVRKMKKKKKTGADEDQNKIYSFYK